MDTVSRPINNLENLGSILTDDSCCPACKRSYALTWQKRARDLELQSELFESELRFQLSMLRGQLEAEFAARTSAGEP